MREVRRVYGARRERVKWVSRGTGAVVVVGVAVGVVVGVAVGVVVGVAVR